MMQLSETITKLFSNIEKNKKLTIDDIQLLEILKEKAIESEHFGCMRSCYEATTREQCQLDNIIMLLNDYSELSTEHSIGNNTAQMCINTIIAKTFKNYKFELLKVK